MFFIGLLSSAALYAVISLLVCVFGLEIEMTTIREAALHPTGFLDWFYAVIFWSLAAYPLLRIIHFCTVRLRRRFNRIPLTNPLFFFLIECTWADITNPFRGLVALKGMSKVIDSRGFWFVVSWGTQVLHLVWSICLWAYFALGLALVYSGSS